MITQKEARRIHRNTQTYVHEEPSGYRDEDGKTLMIRMRISRVPFRKWARKDLIEHTNERAASPKLASILGRAP